MLHWRGPPTRCCDVSHAPWPCSPCHWLSCPSTTLSSSTQAVFDSGSLGSNQKGLHCYTHRTPYLVTGVAEIIDHDDDAMLVTPHGLVLFIVDTLVLCTSSTRYHRQLAASSSLRILLWSSRSSSHGLETVESRSYCSSFSSCFICIPDIHRYILQGTIMTGTETDRTIVGSFSYRKLPPRVLHAPHTHTHCRWALFWHLFFYFHVCDMSAVLYGQPWHRISSSLTRIAHT